MRALALVVVLFAATSPHAAAAEAARGLAGLTTIGVDVELDPSQTFSSAQLVRQIDSRLRTAAPALTIDPASSSRLRFSVLVRPYSATALRGFWLPFSGTYGIGLVRLSVERTAMVTGMSMPLLASVWRAERQAAGPWRESPSEIARLLDETLSDFLDAYHRR